MTSTRKEPRTVPATIAPVVSRKRALTAVALVAATILGASLAGCGGGDDLGDPAGTAVTVGAVKVTNAAVDRMATFLATAPDPSTGEAGKLPAAGSDELWTLRSQAAQDLRDQAVYGILAARCGRPCAVADSAVTAQITTIRTQQFGGSQAEFDATLKDRGITVDDLENILRAGLQEQKLVARQQRGATFTDDQAQAYYQANIAKRYTVPASKRLFHILLASKGDAEALRPQLSAANFSATARARSLDTDAASTGGDLGAVGSPGLIPEIAAASTGLTEGQVSKPVETQFGWHLLMVIGTPATVTPFSEVRDEIVAERLQAAKDRRVQAWRNGPVKRLQDSAVYGNSRLAPAAAATGSTSSTTSTTGATTK